MDGKEIEKLFGNKKEKVKEEISKIYKKIAEDLQNSSLDILTKKITIEEISKVNHYIQNLEQEIRSEAYEKMKQVGVPENCKNIIWVKVRKRVGVPEMKLCHEDEISVTNKEELLREKRGNREGLIIAIAGVCIEILGFLFISAIGKWIVVVEGIGLIAIAGGTYKTYKDVLKTKSEIAINPEKQVTVTDICKKQRELNAKIICDWLDCICKTLLDEIKKEMQK